MLLGKWFLEEGNEGNYNMFYGCEVVILWNLLYFASNLQFSAM